MKNPYLIGEKIYLKPLDLEDAALIGPWANDPEVTRTLSMHRPNTIENEIEFIQRMAKSETDLALGIVRRDDDRMIGVTGLHRIDWRVRQACFGISIGDRSQWDLGLGTEATRLMVRHAFETLNLNRVWLHVNASNPRGERAYEKAGFTREGVLREAAYREGAFIDVITMAILRAGWNPTR